MYYIKLYKHFVNDCVLGHHHWVCHWELFWGWVHTPTGEVLRRGEQLRRCCRVDQMAMSWRKETNKVDDTSVVYVTWYDIYNIYIYIMIWNRWRSISDLYTKKNIWRMWRHEVCTQTHPPPHFDAVDILLNSSCELTPFDVLSVLPATLPLQFWDMDPALSGNSCLHPWPELSCFSHSEGPCGGSEEQWGSCTTCGWAQFNTLHI